MLVAPVATAQIDRLNVARGDRVAAGDVLVEMERRDAEIALSEAEAALAQAESQLANLREGRRPEEIRVIEATLASARAQASEAERSAARLKSLAVRGAATATQADDAATAATSPARRSAEAEANLAVARLPARPAGNRRGRGRRRGCCGGEGTGRLEPRQATPDRTGGRHRLRRDPYARRACRPLCPGRVDAAGRRREAAALRSRNGDLRDRARLRTRGELRRLRRPDLGAV